MSGRGADKPSATGALLDVVSVGELDGAVVEIFGLVGLAVRSATDAFLATDRVAARTLLEGDRVIDSLCAASLETATRRLLDDADVDMGSRRHLLLIVGILPELERSADLAAHIASFGARGLAAWLTRDARSIVADMGRTGCEMWRQATLAYVRADAKAADELRTRDDELDDLHVSLTAELAAERVSVPVAIEMGLVARYFERLGDHAYNITRQLQSATLAARLAG